jgi:phage protein D
MSNASALVALAAMEHAAFTLYAQGHLLFMLKGTSSAPQLQRIGLISTASTQAITKL